jgi:hypothetical protein
MSVISFLVLAGFLLSYFLITSKLTYFAYKYSVGLINYAALLSVSFIFIYLFCAVDFGCDPVFLIFVFLYNLSFWFFYKHKSFQPSLSNIVFYIFFFSVIRIYRSVFFSYFLNKELYISFIN